MSIFRTDPTKTYLVKGATITGMQKRDEALWAGDNIQRGPGIYRRGSGSAGLSLASRPGVSPPPPIGFAQVPFGVSFRQIAPFMYEAMVNPDSDLVFFNPGFNGYASQTITGLGVWFPFIANDVIALYIAINGASGGPPYVPTSATIQSYGAGTTAFDPTKNPWDSSDESYLLKDPTTGNQLGANILLAYSTPDSTGRPYLVQAQTNHLLLEDSNVAGLSCVYDWSHRRRYGITAPGV